MIRLYLDPELNKPQYTTVRELILVVRRAVENLDTNRTVDLHVNVNNHAESASEIVMVLYSEGKPLQTVNIIRYEIAQDLWNDDTTEIGAYHIEESEYIVDQIKDWLSSTP